MNDEDVERLWLIQSNMTGNVLGMRKAESKMLLVMIAASAFPERFGVNSDMSNLNEIIKILFDRMHEMDKARSQNREFN